MRAVVRRVLYAGLLAGGAVLGGAAAAHADDGLLSGNGIDLSAVVPVQVCGIAVGDAAASCGDASSTGAAGDAGDAGGSTAGADDAVASGNDVDLGAAVPVQVCGVSVGVLGDAAASCGEASTEGSAGGGGDGGTGPTGDDAVASGNDVDLGAVAPVQVCGVSVGVLGDAAASCGEASTSGGTAGGGSPAAGEDALLSGNVVDLGAVAPVQVCGVGVGVLGDAAASCGEASTEGSAGGGGDGGTAPTGDDALGSGNEVDLGAVAPVQVCGVGVGVLGDAAASCGEASTEGSAGGGGDGGTAPTGDDALGSGNEVGLGAVAPVQVCGVGAGVLGDAAASCGQASTGGSTGPDEGAPPTGGTPSDGTGSGNDLVAEAELPVQVCGIGVGLLGDATTACVLSSAVPPSEPVPGDPGAPGDPGDPVPGDPGPPGTPDQAEVLDRTLARGVLAADAGAVGGAAADDLADTGAPRAGLLALAGLMLVALGSLLTSRRAPRRTS